MRRRRNGLARFLAPAAFLLGLTIAVLLIRSGLDAGNGAGTTAATPTVPSVVAKRPATTARRTTSTTATLTAAREFYTVQSGDTYGSIAAKYGTTVQQLEQLNPGVSSTSLSVGQKIRVK